MMARAQKNVYKFRRDLLYLLQRGEDMKADCHMHMILDSYDWRQAIHRHDNGPDETFIHAMLKIWQERGFTYLRDGGDRWNAGKRARELAPEYGITYVTPLAPLCREGHQWNQRSTYA